MEKISALGQKEGDDKDEEGDEGVMCVPCGMEASTTEAPKIKIIRDPGDPTMEEIEMHNAGGHPPPRSWCPVCRSQRKGGPALQAARR